MWSGDTCISALTVPQLSVVLHTVTQVSVGADLDGRHAIRS